MAGRSPKSSREGFAPGGSGRTTPFFSFLDRLPSVFFALGEKANP